MGIVAYEGVVDDGLIRLQPEVSLPDKTRVYVVVPELQSRRLAQVPSPRLANPEQAADFKKEIVEGQPDAGVR